MANDKSPKELFLMAPEGHLDKSLHPLIEKWDDYPTSIQLLEVLDACVHGGLGSGFTVTTLQILYKDALKKENKTHEENIPLATWRNKAE